MAFNHLGPYSQEGVWQISGTHLSGEASGIFEVDLNGWGTISVTGAPGGAAWNYYTNDGVYQAFLPKGNYKFTISQPGETLQV